MTAARDRGRKRKRLALWEEGGSLGTSSSGLANSSLNKLLYREKERRELHGLKVGTRRFIN
jgi:hypothetical protein